MSATDKPHWAERDKLKILSNEEYKKLRDLADSNKIALSGVKSFDGSPEVIRESIKTLAQLRNTFPKVTDDRYKLTLELSNSLSAEDFAITHGRIITLNANAYRDVELLQSEYQKLVEDRFFVQGTDYRAVIHHEFGHVVANVYKIDSMKVACEITGLDKIDTLQFVRKNLSRYAFSFSDGTEIISEVFADMSTDNPSEFSRKFYNKVLEIIGGVKK